MKYEEERKRAVSYCGEYCHKCDWHAGRIKEPADRLLKLIGERPELKGWIAEESDLDNLIKGLKWLSESGFCTFTCKAGSGWKGCPVRKCCEGKGISFCFECEEFPCKIWGKWPFTEAKIRNLGEIEKIGTEEWVRKQWVNEKPL